MEDDDIGWSLECVGGPLDGEYIFVKHGHDAVMVRGNEQEWVTYWRTPYDALPNADTTNPLTKLVMPVMVVEEFDIRVITGEERGLINGHRLVPHGPEGHVRCVRCGGSAAPQKHIWDFPCPRSLTDSEEAGRE